MNKTIIFLDFDGVLCDSVKEAYILARYAYFGFDVHKAIEEDLYQKFLNYRYLVSNSWQYYFLMQIIAEGVFESFNDVEMRFNTLTKDGLTNESENFNKKFLAKRKELMENEYDFWNGLEMPTLFLTQLKKIMKNTENCQFAILSTKNAEAIVKKFEFWGIEFDKNFIFEKKDLINLTKGEFINRFLNEHGEYSEGILIDDNEGNINSCANIENVHAMLTSWGYLKDKTKGNNEEKIIEDIKEKL